MIEVTRTQLMAVYRMNELNKHHDNMEGYVFSLTTAHEVMNIHLINKEVADMEQWLVDMKWLKRPINYAHRDAMIRWEHQVKLAEKACKAEYKELMRIHKDVKLYCDRIAINLAMKRGREYSMAEYARVNNLPDPFANIPKNPPEPIEVTPALPPKPIEVEPELVITKQELAARLHGKLVITVAGMKALNKAYFKIRKTMIDGVTERTHESMLFLWR